MKIHCIGKQQAPARERCLDAEPQETEGALRENEARDRERRDDDHMAVHRRQNVPENDAPVPRAA
ncbi:hypothetical protein D3C83_225660 [compost metagenome]